MEIAFTTKEESNKRRVEKNLKWNVLNLEDLYKK
jgi:hypothetical protein